MDDTPIRLVLPAGLVDLVQVLADELAQLHDEADDPEDAADASGATTSPGAAAMARLYPTLSDEPAVAEGLRDLLADELVRERLADLADLRNLLADARSEGSDGGDDAPSPTASPDVGAAVGPDEVDLHLTPDRAAGLLRATHALTVALATRANPDIFTDPDATLPEPSMHSPTGVAALVTSALQDIHEHTLAQLDPETQHHYTRHADRTDTDPDADPDETAN